MIIHWMRLSAIVVLVLIITGTLLLVGFFFYQARQKPDMSGPYVALGSSYAAGLGLGARVPGSPFACQRGDKSYPRELAGILGLPLADMTCSGATVAQVLRGGQFFLGPQIDAIGPNTRLVTISAGGNDVGYIGDLTAIAYRRRGGVIGGSVGLFWGGARTVDDRPFQALERDMRSTLMEVRERAPKARILVVTYSAILPPHGTCDRIGISEKEAELMRQIADRLSDVTRSAALESGASVIDLATLSVGHDACSEIPWVNGAQPEQGAAFHPTFAGTRAAAQIIAGALKQ